MPDKLSVYNGALGHCESRPLATLAEAREARRLLDWAWARGIPKLVLEMGQWDFAARSVMIDASSSVAPQFGRLYAFDIPDDFVRILGVYSDEQMTSGYLDYEREGDYIFANIDTLYVKYVSDDDDYGMDLAKWPQTFTQCVELTLAAEVCGKLTAGRVLKNDLLARAQTMMSDAKEINAADKPTRFPPYGSWTRARVGGWSRGPYGDRGSGGSLTG